MPVELELTSDPNCGGTLADAVRALERGASMVLDEDAERARVRILEFASRHRDALFRSCLPGHLTGSALVVDDDRERVLLMHHVKLGMWLQPGGHADGEGYLEAVALREAREETRIDDLTVAVPAVDYDVHEIPARPGEPRHLHLDVRHLALAPPGATPVANHESHALRWCTYDELDALATDASLRRLARHGLAWAQRV